MTIKQQVRKILDEIIELENLKKQKKLEIKKLYDSCNHKSEKIFSGHKEDIYICSICGYEESRLRNL